MVTLMIKMTVAVTVITKPTTQNNDNNKKNGDNKNNNTNDDDVNKEQAGTVMLWTKRIFKMLVFYRRICLHCMVFSSILVVVM